jgi:hypothetical protein
MTDKRHLSGGKGGKKMKKIPKNKYTKKQPTGQAKFDKKNSLALLF